MGESPKFRTVRGYELLERNHKMLTSAMEDYLEMIYRNSLTEGYMRIHTLSALLNVAAPSATKMVQKLSHLGYLDYKKYGIIALTESGRNTGAYLLRRHEIIESFLKQLGVKEDMLIETELIEHSISYITLKRIECFNCFLEDNQDIVERYEQYVNERGM